MSTKYLKHFPRPLLDELVAGRWLPVVGAGLSRNAEVPSGRSMPLWDELGRAMAGDVEGYEYVGAIDALSAFEHEYGRRELIKRLRAELLVSEAQPGAVHEAFCRLRFDRVITTNFEFLLELGYDRVGESCEVILDEEQLPIPIDRNGTTLLKLHGDLRHPGRLVASEDDYDGFLARYPVLATHVSALLIERVPVLFGYSLDDPDLRQLLTVLRDRLGPMLPTSYVVTVAPDAATIARYGRRGIKVVGLPGSRERYSEILALALAELDEHWRTHALEDARFTEERPHEQIETAVDRKTSRLCYFAVPRSLLAFYREEIFPIAEQAGWVPVSGFDVEIEAGNRLAATRALLEASRLAVIDVSESTGSTELQAAVSALGAGSVLLVTSARTPQTMTRGDLEVVTRATSLADDKEQFVDWIATWFEGRYTHPLEPGLEARSLLELRQWRAALIAAMSDLELLFANIGAGDDGRNRRGLPTRRPSLWRQLRTADLPLDDQLRGRLLDWIGLRNSALHEGRAVSAAEARGAVRDVELVRGSLFG